MTRSDQFDRRIRRNFVLFLKSLKEKENKSRNPKIAKVGVAYMSFLFFFDLIICFSDGNT